MMKLSVLFLSMAITFAAAQAHAVSIKDNMKQIKTLFKGISTAVADSTKNAKSAADAAEIAKLFSAVQGEVPESISDLPADEQPAAIEDYKAMIQQEIDFATALQKAFDSGNNQLAAKLLQQMDGVKKDGHKKYAD
ncbi:MAG: cytochrome b562 [Bdellovibrionia bacterium]